MCNIEIFDEKTQKYVKCPNPEEIDICPGLYELDGDEIVCDCCKEHREQCAQDV